MSAVYFYNCVKESLFHQFCKCLKLPCIMHIFRSFSVSRYIQWPPTPFFFKDWKHFPMNLIAPFLQLRTVVTSFFPCRLLVLYSHTEGIFVSIPGLPRFKRSYDMIKINKYQKVILNLYSFAFNLCILKLKKKLFEHNHLKHYSIITILNH